MGNYRLRLAVMASKGWWLHKLREMGRARSHDNSKKKQRPATTTSSSSSSEKTREARQFSPRKSYYITRELVPDSPRKSSKQRASRGAKSPNRSSRTVVSSSISSDCSCQARRWTKPSSPTEYVASPSFYSPVFSPEAEFRADCVLATNQTVSMKSRNETSKSGEFPELELPPIITKASKVSEPAEESKKTEHQKEAKTRAISVNIVREEKSSPNPMRRVSVSSPAGVRLRVNSPKLAQRRMQRKSVSWRRSLGESTAVVKSSADPQRDFRESMVEMIRANNIRGSKDLEDLLACYLSLNSDEYHHLIINVFKQIWFDLNHLPPRLK